MVPFVDTQLDRNYDVVLSLFPGDPIILSEYDYDEQVLKITSETHRSQFSSTVAFPVSVRIRMPRMCLAWSNVHDYWKIIVFGGWPALLIPDVHDKYEQI